jgi:hypothetical protein
MSPVMPMLLCPSRSATALMCTPASSHATAPLWRRVCTPTSSTPATNLTLFAPAISAITLGLLGPRLLAPRIGRNEAVNHAGAYPAGSGAP